MGRHTGPKDKLSRREGTDLFGGGVKVKLDSKPGMHGSKRPGKLSDFGRQMRAKQRAKRIYGIRETQFSNYMKSGAKSGINIRDALAASLETRLDNVIYRLGWAKSRPAARQLVSHGHVTIDGKMMNIPSYRVKVGEFIEVKKLSFEPEGKYIPPEWLEKKDNSGKMVREPVVTDLMEPISLSDIIEFYSR